MNSVKHWYCNTDLRTVLDSIVSRNIFSTTNIQEFWMQGILIIIMQKRHILTSQLHFQLLTLHWYHHMNPPVTHHQTSLKTEWCAIFNNGDRDEVTELCIHLHKLLHSSFFSVKHCTVLHIFNHHIYVLLNLVFKICEFTKEQGNVISFQIFCERNSLEDTKSKALKIIKHTYANMCPNLWTFTWLLIA